MVNINSLERDGLRQAELCPRHTMKMKTKNNLLPDWVVQGDWNAKVGKDAQADWGEVCGPYCNVETNERGLRLLEFATFNNLVLTNTLGPHKPSRRWTWHSPDGKHHNQIDYILVKKRFRSGVNIHRTRSFPGADIGSDHDLVMMTFQVRLKKTRKPNQPRLRFDLDAEGPRCGLHFSSNNRLEVRTTPWTE